MENYFKKAINSKAALKKQECEEFLKYPDKFQGVTWLREELVPTLMIDDAETKMCTEAAVLFELKTSVPFCHTLQICELIYVD
jgi:hypothetical protein